MNLSKDGKGRIRIKVRVNGSRKEQGLRMQDRKKMGHQKRNLMHLDKDMDHVSSIELKVLDSWSVEHVVRNTLRDIVHRIRVVGLIYIVHRRHILLGMLVKAFLVFMQHWITNRQTTMHLSLRWMVRFVINLFIL